MRSETEWDPKSGGGISNAHLKVVAIDGPAAAGKTTVASLVAARLGAMLFGHGALYRAVTLAALRAGLGENDEHAIANLTRRSAIPSLSSDNRRRPATRYSSQR